MSDGHLWGQVQDMSPMLSTDECRAPLGEAALPHLLQDHQILGAQFVNMKQTPAEMSVQSRAVQRKGVLKLKQQKSLPHQLSYLPSAQYLSSTIYAARYYFSGNFSL